MQLPTGEYLEDQLINLGTNRFTFRPQLVVVHNRGPWSFKATAIASLYTDNDEFFDGNELEQDAFYTLEGHIVYTFRPGLWVGAGAGYGYGGESTVNGKGKGDRKENFAWGLSFGYHQKVERPKAERSKMVRMSAYHPKLSVVDRRRRRTLAATTGHSRPVA